MGGPVPLQGGNRSLACNGICSWTGGDSPDCGNAELLLSGVISTPQVCGGDSRSSLWHEQLLCPNVPDCHPGPTSVRGRQVLRVTGMAGKACDHQARGAELQPSEVEVALWGVPHRESEKWQLDSSAGLQPRCAAARADLCLLKAQVGTWAASLHGENHLSVDVHLEGAFQPEPAGMG